ncbi:unnamed protein product [Danaus chrysippus]|uniref:(African queen) hypothetical protein n=1 Tax=Danaus chrysippus TaxID=151541 RepID=A0A8J2VTN5_9NEOP|nr:unnamed protein product [Danaus chrysippus]
MAHYDFKNFMSTKFIDDFGKEFKKHEVLWQSYLLMDPNRLKSNFSTGRNHSSLILLYKLMVAARTFYSQELQVNKIGNAEKDENNDKNKSENDTEKVLDDLNKSKPSQKVTDEAGNNENAPKINQANGIDMENDRNYAQTNNSKDVSTSGGWYSP